MRERRQQTGFTLVEMAMVLVVIGLIIGAIAIGKDLQRNAVYTKVKEKFIDQWTQVYNDYYQRTGHVLGDIEGTPLSMVNAAKDYGSSSLPNVSTITKMGTPLCGESATASGDQSLQDLLNAAGITPPTGRGPGSEDTYLYLDSNGNPQQISICLRWVPPSTSSPGTGNMMVISGLTPDLARFLDSAIDGHVDGMSGLFRRAKTSGSGVAAADWPSGNNVDSNNNTVSDTQRVQTVTAYYRMNE